MSQDSKKKAAAEKALQLAVPAIERGEVIGVGTGSTVNFLIDAMAAYAGQIAGAIPSSEATAKRLKANGIELTTLDLHPSYGIYIDGADEADSELKLIKGGGGALTREKILAASAETFICIVDDSKCVDTLGTFPLPIEIIPIATAPVMARLKKLGGTPAIREGFITDNGQCIVDVSGLSINEPMLLETELNQWPGVVCNGLFAQRGADTLVIATDAGIEVREAV